jgi:lysophospholipase L1-like esterase
MTWLWVGDSILKGLIPLLTAVFVGRGEPAYFEANNGWSTRHCLNESCYRLGDRYHPEIVVVMLGTNDFSDEEHYKDRVHLLAELLTGDDTQLVWVGPFNSEERNRWTEEAIASRPHPEYYHWYFIDGMELAEGLERTADGVHFRRRGNEALAERVVAAVDGVLTIGGCDVR